MIPSSRFLITLSSALILLLVAFFSDLLIGSVDIPLSKIIEILLSRNESDAVLSDIVWKIRLPKALTAIIAGAGLGLGGLLTQTLFRNPLAGPDVLGLSGGSSLAVAIILLTNLGFGIWTVAGAATVGAAMVFAIVMAVAKKLSGNSSLLIIGLMIGALTSSVVGILQFMSRADDLQIYTLWTMGNIASTSENELWIMLAFSIAGIVIALTSIKSMNAWLLGERYSMTMGLNISGFRWKTLLATSFITGSITAFCGPISFVGIAAPHFVKRIFPTNNHQYLIPLTMLGGALLMLVCDMLTLLPGNEIIIPINAATALFGAPVIIWIVIQSKKEFY